MNITDAIVLMLLGAFLVSFVYFSMVELDEKVSTRDAKAQMKEISEYIVHGVTNTYLSGKNINAPHVRIVKELHAPQEINGHVYTITLTKAYVEVYCPELDYFVRTYLNIDESIIVEKGLWAEHMKVIYLKEDEEEKIELV